MRDFDTNIEEGVAFVGSEHPRNHSFDGRVFAKCAAASFAGMTVAGSALAIAKIACEMMREASEREIRFMGSILAK